MSMRGEARAKRRNGPSPKGMLLAIVNGDAVLVSIHSYPTKCLHQPGAVSPLFQHRFHCKIVPKAIPLPCSVPGSGLCETASDTFDRALILEAGSLDAVHPLEGFGYSPISTLLGPGTT